MKEVKTSDIEKYLREFADECFKYIKKQISATDLGMSQVVCAVEIKKLFEDKKCDTP